MYNVFQCVSAKSTTATSSPLWHPHISLTLISLSFTSLSLTISLHTLLPSHYAASVSKDSSGSFLFTEPYHLYAKKKHWTNPYLIYSITIPITSSLLTHQVTSVWEVALDELLSHNPTITLSLWLAVTPFSPKSLVIDIPCSYLSSTISLLPPSYPNPFAFYHHTQPCSPTYFGCSLIALSLLFTLVSLS